MLFDWLRGNKRTKARPSLADEVLSLSPAAFARFVEQAILREIPATRAMYVVAYDNLRPMSQAMYSASIEQSGKPFLVEDFIKLLSVRLAGVQDEVGLRRVSWFFVAANLARLDKLARDDVELRSLGAKCWTMLAQSAPHLKSLLTHNIVWKADEKSWYEVLETERDFVSHVLSHTMPNHYLRQEQIKKLASEHRLFLVDRDSDYFAVR